ncbi:RDD family protein [Streptomyces mangrovisoli]|uniref:RDD family protein n=1 Tax=Streptomyces mangrovisoli TaxID=1428628 RepID=A0A1J4P2J4_9ACTN|nr:RDD family protein [Streptomyces mangrovisoli]OIJ67654.1 hypothetical protein WN71_012040 [Streptomyces mangrovisoli]
MSAPTPAPGDDRPREGYYPDPSIPGYVRYWNGAAWVPGTSRPAPQDGRPLVPPAGSRPAPAQVEETGPHFFDEDPPGPGGDDQYGNRPEPASAWGADSARQSGFGDHDRRISWGAQPAADPADDDAAQGAHGPGAQGAAGAPAAGTPGFAAGKAAAARAAAKAQAGQGQAPQVPAPQAHPQGAQLHAQPQSPAGPAGPAGPAQAAQAQPGPVQPGPVQAGPAQAAQAQASFPSQQAPYPASDRPAPQPQVPAQDPSPGPAGQAGRPGLRAHPLPPNPAAPEPAAPQVPQQTAGPGSPAPMTGGPGGGQSSWAQQVHRLAGADDDQPVTPWKPPVDDPFQAAARRQAAARPAGLGRRLAARLVDSVVLAAVTAAAAVPLAGRAVDHVQAKIDAAKLSGRTVTVWLLDGTTSAYLGIVLGVLLVFGVLYEVLPTARWGRTVGKKLCGVQVQDIEGHEPPTFGASLRRWLVYVVPGLLGIGLLGVAWCLFDRPWHQCWHDKAAHTFVAR